MALFYAQQIGLFYGFTGQSDFPALELLSVCIISATRETISLSRKMAEAGAKALLIVTPCFYKGSMNNEALISHYTKVILPLPTSQNLAGHSLRYFD